VNWTKIVITVVASVWFFPVNCTGTLYAGTALIAKLDARDVDSGETVHPLFSFVVEPGDNGEQFLAAHLSELPNFKGMVASSGATGTHSFLISSPTGRITSNNSQISYKVTEATTSGQIIEVIETYLDGDNTIWSRYKASQSTITPISSRMFYFGYMFGAFPYAIGFALIVYGIGRYFAHRNRTLEMVNGDT